MIFFSAKHKAFYDSAIHGPNMPDDAVSITRTAHADLMAAQSNGKRIEPDAQGYPVAVDPPAPSLDTVKVRAQAWIDREAEAQRLARLTPGEGQMLEYEATQRETRAARAALDAGETLDPADYPMLEAERLAYADAGVTKTLAEIVAAIEGEIATWKTLGASIKRTRRAAKMAIDAAQSAEEVQAVLDGITWPDGN